MKHIWLALPLFLGLAACSKVDKGSQNEGTTPSESADVRGDTPPGINPSVAPGVAFDFSYGFTLPERQIAAVQERHATLCGSLGTTHCRLTAIHFDKARGGSIDADMTFLVDPAMAMGFARDATTLVEKADGTLATSRVTGENVGTTIIANDKSSAGILADLAKIDAQLRIPGLSKDVRGALVTQSGELRAQLRALRQARDEHVESLATTPVRFAYDVAPEAIGNAWLRGLGNGALSATAIVSVLAYLLAAIWPFAVLGGLGWLGLRQFRTRRRTAATAE